MSQIQEQIPPGDGSPSLPLDLDAVNHNDPFLVVCRCFCVITAVSAILCVIVNAFSAFLSFKNGADVFDGILRCYAVVIALFVAVAETEWERVHKFWTILQYWVGRGMLQIFVAVMTKSLSNGLSSRRAEVILHQVASYLLLVCGIVYVIAGLLCLGTLKRSRLRKTLWRDQAIKDLQDVERRKKELERLLSGQP
eukprot:c19431_g1_i1 orf=156-740(+)